MKKEMLIQYCDLQKEIKKLESRIEKIHRQSEMISDVVQNGYKRHTVICGYDFKRKNKLEMLEATLRERYNKLLETQNNIEMWINAIEKSDIRQIFEHRYIDGMNWLQIQFEMEYGHEDTARKKHDKFLEENL